MKLIIDIDENDYEYMKNGYVPHRFNMFYAIKNGTPIPDNATNGDVIKAMFPNRDFIDRGYIYQYPLDEMYHDFSIGWWNAPYKKGGAE